MLVCPICKQEVTPYPKNPAKYLCYNCRKKIPERMLVEIPEPEPEYEPFVDISDSFPMEEPQIPAYPEQPLPTTYYRGDEREMPFVQDTVYPGGYDDDEEYYEGDDEDGQYYEQPYEYASMGEPQYAPVQEPVRYADPRSRSNRGRGKRPPQENVGYAGQSSGEDNIVPSQQEQPQADAKSGGMANSKIYGIISLIFGILALVMAILPWGSFFPRGSSYLVTPAVIAFMLGIAALVSGRKSKGAGKALGVFGLVLAVLSLPASYAADMFFGNSGNSENTADIVDGNSNKEKSLKANENVRESSPDSNVAIPDEDIDEEEEEMVPAEPEEEFSVAPEAPVDIHGRPDEVGGYRNDFFDVSVSNDGGRYTVIVDTAEATELNSTLNENQATHIYGSTDEISASSLDAYFQSRLDLEGGELRTVTVAGHEATAFFHTDVLPDDVEEHQIVLAKIVDGKQFDLTVVAPNEELAMAALGCVVVF